MEPSICQWHSTLSEEGVKHTGPWCVLLGVFNTTGYHLFVKDIFLHIYIQYLQINLQTIDRNLDIFIYIGKLTKDHPGGSHHHFYYNTYNCSIDFDNFVDAEVTIFKKGKFF